MQVGGEQVKGGENCAGPGLEEETVGQDGGSLEDDGLAEVGEGVVGQEGGVLEEDGLVEEAAQGC
eukprot:4636075-Lingulodinium_polyedra.AAC.1